MKRNKLNLTLAKLSLEHDDPEVPAHRSPADVSSLPPTKRPNEFEQPRANVDFITQTLNELDMDNNARNSLRKFLSQKQRMGEIHPDDLETLGELGAGNGGIVKKARHKPTQLIMARKLIHLEVRPAIQMQILRELRVLHDCNFPHIVGFYHAFQSDGEISICMEYMDAGSLDLILKRVGRIPEAILGKITLAVLKGLQYLHDKHAIMHRDVKPCNILVNSSGEIKICDFGVSGQLIDSMANSFIGTRSYMSPERLEGIDYSVQSDIWSLGLSLIEMAIGLYPIPSPEQHIVDKILTEQSRHMQHEQKILAIFDLMECIINNPPPRLEHKTLSQEFTNFLDACLKKNPTDRADLNTLLAHAWVKKYESLDVDISKWVCRIMNLPPPTPN